MQIEHEYRTVDKAVWGPGPWQDEPDKIQGVDTATGLPCLIVRSSLGALCGYVGVDAGHPLFEREYGDGPDELLAVHGGITYSAPCMDGADEATGICHIPAPGQPDHVWWLGFDCAHSGDFVPGMAATLRSYGPNGYALGIPRDWETYRDVAYVRAECASLAAQLHTLRDVVATDIEHQEEDDR